MPAILASAQRAAHLFRRLGVGLTALVVAGAALPMHVQAAAEPAITPGACVQGTLPFGALSAFCVPSSGWNGDLVVYAHGYVPVSQPLGFYQLTSPSGLVLPEVVQQLGFAFATTSYRQNGLSILQGVDDIDNLIQAFRSIPALAGTGLPRHTYVIGVSEGGLVATLDLERHPELMSGAVAACGPIGSFRGQINYIGDVRVLFDYFFPGVIPGSPIAVPQSLIDGWTSTYVPRVQAAIVANPGNAAQLINVAQIETDPSDPSTVTTAIVDALSYNIVGTNDAAAKLGGNPYDNRSVHYTGSSNDTLLNQKVERFDAAPAAVAAMTRYETAGTPFKPLVTIHTTADDVVPAWQEVLYRLKLDASHASGPTQQFPVFRFGHCNFTSGELLFTFGALVSLVAGSQPAALTQRPDVQQAARDIRRNQGRPLPQPPHR